MKKSAAGKAIEILGREFPGLRWNFQEQRIGLRTELISQWLGAPDEEIMVCVFKGKEIHERFHRQDFFFINYAYRGDYGAQSYRFDNHVTVKQGECYIGQPFSAYALYGASDEDIVIIGVLIKKEVFYRAFLPAISADSRLVHFFLDPKINSFSDEFIHLEDLGRTPVREQLELMAEEYASHGADTQAILRPMALTLILMLARSFKAEKSREWSDEIAEKMIVYLDEHLDCVNLERLADAFGYHPA